MNHMQTTGHPIRTLIIVALACSVFGGVIGALATAATQSQATPTAMAAAVQRVEDQAVRRQLVTIFQRLGQTNGDLSSVAAEVKTLNRTTRSELGYTGVIGVIGRNAYQTCRAVNGVLCAFPPATAG